MLSGCGQAAAPAPAGIGSESAGTETASAGTETAPSGTGAYTSAGKESSQAEAEPQEQQSSGGAMSREDLMKMEIDPPYDFNPEDMIPADFGTYFEHGYNSGTASYLIGEGTELENQVTVIKGAEDGPAVYVVAGVHGDETAAWLTGNLLKKISIQAGTLYILSPANKWGAAEVPGIRYVTGEQDLNRSFPGNPEGTKAEQAAAFIFEDIKQKAPDFVFDLHEARIVKEGRDFLGSTLIFTDLGDKMTMLVDMILETQMGTLCGQQFDYLGPGPKGSVNYTVSTELSIPVITVETFRGYQMEHRISDQLDIVQYVLRDYGLVE